MTAMLRLVSLLLFALLLAACAEESVRHPTQLRAQAGFASLDAEVVVVQVTEIPPGTTVEEIALIDPAGQRLLAESFERGSRQSGPGYTSGGFITFGVTGGSSSGINPSVSVGQQLLGGGPTLATALITAAIALPDPAAYRTDFPRWRVEISYRDVTGLERLLTLPAPRIG